MLKCNKTDMQNKLKSIEALDENFCYSRNMQYLHPSKWKHIGSGFFKTRFPSQDPNTSECHCNCSQE